MSTPLTTVKDTNVITGLQKRILSLTWLGFFFDAYTNTVLSFISVALITSLHLTKSQFSTILGLQLLCTAIGGVLFGWLGDVLGRKKSLQLSILIFALGSFLTGISTNAGMLILSRIIAGLGVGGEWGIGQTLVGETFPARHRGKGAALLQAASPISIMLSSVVGTLIAPAIGWHLAMILSAIPALLVFYIRRWLPESPLWEETRKKEKNIAPVRVLGDKRYRRNLITIFLLCLFMMFGFWIPYSWLPGYLELERHVSLIHSLGWFMILQVGSLIGYVSYGWVADRLGRRWSLTLYSVVLAIGVFGITVMWNDLTKMLGLLEFAMFITGIGTGTFSGVGPLIVEAFPTEFRSTAAGFIWNVARGFTFFGPILVTAVAPIIGLSGGIALAGIFALLTAITSWFLRETAGRELDF
ncbi:MFS transporter [Alicyclobacillus tolerans]|uniref:MFS transporter n=1 Tax=Alicyclobacillus tolerans TaxID=90970 RepID=UPI001F009B96|nr:MFS transporter [Alicyclobacillus tolerans]MCF8567968.1 MFS transporter [Alicyclobacillus tolerans]